MIPSGNSDWPGVSRWKGPVGWLATNGGELRRRVEKQCVVRLTDQEPDPSD